MARAAPLSKFDHERQTADLPSEDLCLDAVRKGFTDNMLTVERPVREVIKLFNIMDTTLLRDIEVARKLAQAMVEKGGDGRAESAQLTHTIGSEDPIFCQQQCFSSVPPNSEKNNICATFVFPVFYQFLIC